eukprot:CAMPEP_0203675868 /NCGR_PEP_ID=MMETSP0090-20130426/22485_1 /ASSEMBLY_ACC=CAM_ASM_001088 /TAXON_ID=426623 /ORGANISM="Chaetoceros affinis, Strain CCMP159" /LENGTH=459 /DNA_ID=CAMNT_0050542215 /DNA_START=107 /DNA_END=1486 /DNA_ORIENTATION=+
MRFFAKVSGVPVLRPSSSSSGGGGGGVTAERNYWSLRRIAFLFLVVYVSSLGVTIVLYNINYPSSEGHIEESLLSTTKATTTTTTTMTMTRENDTAPSLSANKNKRQCRVIIEDKVDYHFEVIESIIKRYPLPIHKFDGCDYQNQPIHFQFSLYQNRVDVDKLNQTMYWKWYQYYDKYLKGTKVDRFDGSVAYIGEMITYGQYLDSALDAIIGVTCDWSVVWYKFIELERNYCVLHGTIDKPNLIYKPNDGREKRLCWLNPMFKDKCYFLPIDLPSRELLDQDETVKQLVPPRDIDEIRICVIGNKDFVALAEALLAIGTEYLNEHHVKVHVHTRKENSRKQYKRKSQGLLDSIVSFILDEPFLPFQRRISQCSIILPMVDPETQSRYFPGDLQKLSGSVSQLVAYKIPSVMRKELYDIYEDSLVGISVKLHHNGIDSFVSAIKAMVKEVRSNRTLGTL